MNNHKYIVSRFANKRELEDTLMADQKVDDLDKLLIDFELHQTEVKKHFPQLFYCLLAVKDKHISGYRLVHKSQIKGEE